MIIEDYKVEQLNDLMNAISKLRNVYQSQDYVVDIKKALDSLLGAKAKCFSVRYTYNTDKLPFACVVFPIIDGLDLIRFIAEGNNIEYDRYELEIDSKMFDYGLTDEQIARVIVFNTVAMMIEMENPKHLCEAIVSFFNNTNTCLLFNSAIRYAPILQLGILDACNRLTSCLSLPDEFFDSHIDDELRDALKLLYREMADCDNEVFRSANLTMLIWALRIYTNINNIDQEESQAIRVLRKARNITASQLYIAKIDRAIKSLMEPTEEECVKESMINLLTESSNKKGLIASLKYNGLRNTEYDVYEFYSRALIDYTENDLMYAFKQINARLAIIDDYIRENPNDPEIKRWIKVKNQYEDIRATLAKKKIDRSIQSIFVDYNK